MDELKTKIETELQNLLEDEFGDLYEQGRRDGLEWCLEQIALLETRP